MKKFLIGLLVGIFLGWITVGLVQASDSDAKTYKELLRKLISLVEDVQRSSAITASNTSAMRKKLGAD